MVSGEGGWVRMLSSVCHYAGEYPWHAAILKREELDNLYVCGGSLVRGDTILTAAHCVDKYNEAQLRSEQ